MGYSAVFVVYRGLGRAVRLRSVERLAAGARSVEFLGDWTVCEFDEEPIFDAATLVLREIEDNTSAPGMIGTILDSDCIWAIASSPRQVEFRFCLGRDATERYLEEEGHEMDDVFLRPDAALLALMGWARSAGNETDAAELMSLLALHELTPGASQDVWTTLLRSLGIRPGHA